MSEKNKYKYGFCGKCGEQLRTDFKHQAYFCPQCKEWLTEKCSNPECEYCKDRPNVPNFSQ